MKETAGSYEAPCTSSSEATTNPRYSNENALRLRAFRRWPVLPLTIGVSYAHTRAPATRRKTHGRSRPPSEQSVHGTGGSQGLRRLGHGGRGGRGHRLRR